MREYFKKMSFTTKIILAVWLITVLIMSIALQIRSKQIARILKERMAFRTGVITDIVGFSISEKNVLNKSIVEEYSKLILREPEIEYVIFYDKNDKLIEIAGKFKKNQIINKKTENIFNLKDNFYDVYKEIYGKSGNKIGSIIVGFPMDSLKSAQRTDLITGIIVWLSAILLILIFTYATLKYLFRPLKYLLEGAISIEHKQFGYRIPIANDDEIGKISSQFNTMADKLQNFYAELENKIKEATSELQLSNKNLKERTDELEKLNQRLNEIDRRKSEFVSIVAHDLKTPLTSIMGFADTLANDNIKINNESRGKYLNIIRMESRRLARLISDFLDLSKIEEGILKLKIEKANIREVVDKVINFVDAKTKNIAIQIEEHTDINELNIDRDRVTQVFQNILVNAINHSPRNSQIKIKIVRFLKEIQISIIDQGPGVPDCEKEKIFNKFYRIDNDITRKERGTGLGLSIAKSIVELHGGGIWVKDNEPTGSCFTFSLPIG